MSRPPLLPQARPFKTLVFTVRIESPNGRPPAFRCEHTILPDNRVISALMNGRNAPRQRRVSGSFDDNFQPFDGTLAQGVDAGPGCLTIPAWPWWPRPGGPPPRPGRSGRHATAADEPRAPPVTTSFQRVNTTSSHLRWAAPPRRPRSRGPGSRSTRLGPSSDGGDASPGSRSAGPGPPQPRRSRRAAGRRW